MGKPHILAIPYPAQGHVIPMMDLSRNLAKQGFKISFMNTEFIHKRVIDAFGKKPFDEDDGLFQLVSIPDGLEDWEDRNRIERLCESLCQVIPRELKKFIGNANKLEDDKITCVLTDITLRQLALDIAAELGIRTAVFSPASVYQFVAALNIPKLIDDGLIDETGNPINTQKMFQLLPSLPALHSKNFVWLSGDSTIQKFLFHYMKEASKSKGFEKADWVLCNSSLDLEPDAFSLVPKVLPVGPLSASDRIGNFSGNFWPEDSTCLQWLDQQPPGSIIYVAFGSSTVFDQTGQFQELALGLELTDRPFLWVVRSDLSQGRQDVYPEGFLERVACQGKIVSWAPQGAVLAHPSIACFISHCGWNSTIEGVSNGLPFLCWPQFGDQFLNEDYISDTWKVGLRFERDERGVITKEEIKIKVEKLLNDKNFKRRAIELKEKVVKSVNEGGNSARNLNNFIKWLKS